MSSTRNLNTANCSNNHIIQRLKKISPENIADALELLHLPCSVINSSVSRIEPINYTQALCGPVYTVTFTRLADPRLPIVKNNRDYLQDVPPNKVLVISNEAGNEFSVWGGLLSYYAQKHNILGVITNGSARDIDEIHKNHLPVFAAGATCMRSTGRYKVVAVQSTININGVDIKPDDFVIAGPSGMAIIDPKYLEQVLVVAEKKHEEELQIAKLMKQGDTLSEIDAKMKREMPVKGSVSTLSLFSKTAILAAAAVTSALVGSFYFTR